MIIRRRLRQERQYAVIEELENLERIQTKNNLNKADYFQQKQNLIDRISRIEEQRLWQIMADDILDSLESIERALLALDRL